MSKVLYHIIVLFGVSFSIQTAEQRLPEESPAKRARVEDPRGPELVEAVRENNFEIMQKLLNQGVSIFTRSELGSSLLNIAIGKGNKEIFYYLIENGLGCDVNFQNNEGTTPLLLAAQFGHFEIVRFLLKKGAFVNFQNNEGTTPLILAAQFGHFKIVRFLLKKGALVDLKHNSGSIPLSYAVNFGHTSVVEELLNHGASVDNSCQEGFTPLMIAAQESYNSICRLLLNYGANVAKQDKRGITPLMIAAADGNHQMVQEFLRSDNNGINLQNQRGETALWLAAIAGHKLIVQLLLKNKADLLLHRIESPLYTPVAGAAMHGHVPVIRAIEDACKDRGIPTIFAIPGAFEGFNYALFNGHHFAAAYLANRYKEGGGTVCPLAQNIMSKMRPRN